MEKERAKPAAQEPEDDPGRETLAEAIERFQNTKQKSILADGTIDKLTTIFKKQMLAFMDGEGLVYLDEITMTHIEDFRDTWIDVPLAGKKKQERVSGFFYYCLAHRW